MVDFSDMYEKRSPLFGTQPTHVVELLVAELGKPPNRDVTVVDLGCGDGRDSLYMLRHGLRVVAVDLAAPGLEHLMSQAKQEDLDDRLLVVESDVRQFRFDAIDGVVGITILDHLPREDALVVVGSASRAIRSGGLIALEVHSDRDPAAIGDPDQSEFSRAIRSFWRANELASFFMSDWRVLHYSDRVERDLDHGPPHRHGFSTILARKEQNR